LLNENASRLIGQAAYGPGWKRRLVEVNVEVTNGDNPISKVITTRTPTVISNPEEALKDFGIRRLFSRLAIHAVALVPLIAGGQVLGVLAVQPGADDTDLDDEAMTLLASLANEIAGAIFAKRLEERIAESERMRTAGLLAGGIAHNFNNLLQAILGQASLLEMQGAGDNRILRAAKIINEAASKGATLVKQLLSFAHMEEANKQTVSVNSVIRMSQNILKRLLKGNHRLVLTLEENLPKIMVDDTHLVRILTSLVSNAVEAMVDGGDVEIFSDTVSVGRASPHYEVPFGSYVRIGVRDSGVGMDDEVKRRCFEPFFTKKNIDPHTGISTSGAGLGLAAAYALARRNGGRLVVESRLGHGSVFTLYLPVAKEIEKADETVQRSAVSDTAVTLKPEISPAEEKKPKVEMLRVVSDSDDNDTNIDVTLPAREPEFEDNGNVSDISE
jgi:signal transduction histidine kinase